MFTLVSTASSASMHTTCYTHESFHERTAGFAFLIRAELVPIIKLKQLQIKKEKKYLNITTIILSQLNFFSF